MPERRRYSPSTERNQAPLLAVLRRLLPASGLVLEVASGTGQHGAHFAKALPDIAWQPTDLNEDMLDSIEGWGDGLANLQAPLRLDTCGPWPIEHADAVFCANMIHISPWEATVGLFEGAAKVLCAGAPLITYGPYRVDGAHTASTNATFDRSLQGRDPSWGIRNVEALEELADAGGLHLEERVAMPANNFVLCFRRRG